jgi:ubiquinone biosynthesis protein Coq4
MPALVYPPEMTLGDARARYFELNNFGPDGGYHERWIKVKVWRIPIWLPNTAGRVRAVKLHDLHHVLTEYPTTWRGEAEISAWELGSGGLKKYYAGWVLDILNLAQGLVVNPVGLYRGFMRGRRSKNLFSTKFTDEILEHRVGEYRRLLDLERAPGKPTLYDQMIFVIWIIISMVSYLVAVAPVWLTIVLIALWVLWR